LTAMRDVISLIQMIKETRKNKFDVTQNVPTIHCKMHEDNSGCINMVNVCLAKEDLHFETTNDSDSA